MRNEKAGEQIRRLRLEKNLTQKELAEKLGISDKTVSKWECGGGLPDTEFWPALSELLSVPVETILQGEVRENPSVTGNLKKAFWYVCPLCGNLILSTGVASITCCDRKLSALIPQKAEPEQRLKAERVEDEWFITSSHPMTKTEYISFLAVALDDQLQILKQYPEWDIQARIRLRRRGTLLWYSTRDGLLYQPI